MCLKERRLGIHARMPKRCWRRGWLEEEVSAELELTHAAQRGGRAADDVGDLAAGRAVDAIVRGTEVDVVEDVARSDLEGQLRLFVEGDCLAQRGVCVEYPRSEDVVGLLIALSKRRRTRPDS